MQQADSAQELSALNSVPFASMILTPLTSAIMAQTQSVQHTINFINTFGMSGDELKVLESTTSDGTTVTNVRVPWLKILPPPTLLFNSFIIKFNARLSSSEIKIDSTAIGASLEAGTSKGSDKETNMNDKEGDEALNANVAAEPEDKDDRDKDKKTSEVQAGVGAAISFSNTSGLRNDSSFSYTMECNFQTQDFNEELNSRLWEMLSYEYFDDVQLAVKSEDNAGDQK
mmetsp:Transcript_28420/g.71379  ORF Transcript_28420/g.71379 Transcript_28420/m.71379 type:complete len:228 (-) Transcript_28420:562-1245(-)|eukprot:CAMPEP_0177682786 /NCGR_PEP_ID=MMETSP0447-20121125/31438_1 /TAXON_ID=0 /ORGANISM="Stygamoeba regulata, Strain BSH-02190019" /LENGTH=227 /DNA_ID=CAMNT_0019192299 /DNA_START=168 /DNA_END=851 /DNA_ORIENTATION=-